MARLALAAVLMFGVWLFLAGAIVAAAPYIAGFILLVLICLLLSKGKPKDTK